MIRRNGFNWKRLPMCMTSQSKLQWPIMLFHLATKRCSKIHRSKGRQTINLCKLQSIHGNETENEKINGNEDEKRSRQFQQG